MENFINTFWSMESKKMNKEELEMAIENCKELILETSNQENDKKRQLIRELVQLRRQLHEIKEGLVADVDDKIVCGHRFVAQSRKSNESRFCDKCGELVWGLVQSWFRCASCGFYCHAKCLHMVTRVCASVKVCLDAQKYRCAECRTKICIEVDKQQLPLARLCDYSGLYFCGKCQWTDETQIPARIVHNWDFDSKPVGRNSKQFLKTMQKKPVLRLEDLNPHLFSYIQELRSVKALRCDLMLMKPFVMSCREASNLHLFALIKPYGHFLDGVDAYSIQDLIDIQNGVLENRLKTTLDVYMKHIKIDCQTCRGNGFVCEFCQDKEILFPFDDFVVSCRQCRAVYHRLCFDKNNAQCPRCQRRTRRQSENLSTTNQQLAAENTECCL